VIFWTSSLFNLIDPRTLRNNLVSFDAVRFLWSSLLL